MESKKSTNSKTVTQFSYLNAGCREISLCVESLFAPVLQQGQELAVGLGSTLNYEVNNFYHHGDNLIKTSAWQYGRYLVSQYIFA